MIEFIEYSTRSQEVNVEGVFENGFIVENLNTDNNNSVVIGWDYRKELCDALWEAVKYILSKHDDR